MVSIAQLASSEPSRLDPRATSPGSVNAKPCILSQSRLVLVLPHKKDDSPLPAHVQDTVVLGAYVHGERAGWLGKNYANWSGHAGKSSARFGLPQEADGITGEMESGTSGAGRGNACKFRLRV